MAHRVLSLSSLVIAAWCGPGGHAFALPPNPAGPVFPPHPGPLGALGATARAGGGREGRGRTPSSPSPAGGAAVPSQEQLMEDCRRYVLTEHEEEFRRGSEVFGSSLGGGGGSPLVVRKEDFHTYEVGEDDYGPVSDPAELNHNGRRIYQSLFPVISEAECDLLISLARETIAEGKVREKRMAEEIEKLIKMPPAAREEALMRKPQELQMELRMELDFLREREEAELMGGGPGGPPGTGPRDPGSSPGRAPSQRPAGGGGGAGRDPGDDKGQDMLGGRAAGGMGERKPSNSDLGEARLSFLPPAAIEILRKNLREKLYPMLQSRYGADKDLTLYDGLILGSVAPSVSQPVHRDASLITINIPLSPQEAFRGGGTYLEPLEGGFHPPIVMDRGHALFHASGVPHAGVGVDEGERWVLVMFLISRTEPQIGRRCHSEGIQAADRGEMELAKGAFRAGVAAAPDDHLLQISMGSIAQRRENAFRSLARAARCYPSDRKALMTMGNMMLEGRRPRAALRRYDQVLDSIGDRDMVEGTWMPLKALGWEARVSAARACMLCAEFEAERAAERAPPFREGERPWTLERMPKAIERLEMALMAAPGDEGLQGLLARAEELLREAEGERGTEGTNM